MKRALIFAAAVFTTAASGAQRPATELAIVVDADSPVADAVEGDRLRATALTGGDPGIRPVSFVLTARGFDQVPLGQTVSGLHVDEPHPVYNGVSMSFAEASEILRKNEAMRDTVIRRTCSARGDCGAAVHAAAIALVDDTETASAAKIRSLLEISKSAKTIVVMTAGWPYRDEQRLGLDKAIASLKADGTRLVVWNLPPAFRYQGVVRDACETIASAVAGTVVALKDEADAERARTAWLGSGVVESRPASPVAIAPPAPAAPPVAGESAGVDAMNDAALVRAASYVAGFERTFASVIWRERYRQEDRVQQRFPASGGRFTALAGRRELESDMLLLWLPREASWIAVRDVIAVDGIARPASDRRLKSTLEASSVSIDALKQLAAENGRFNIGQILRTFNEPTLALSFLDEHYRQRFSFTRGEERTVDGRRAVRFVFVEQARPTIIRARDHDVPVRGDMLVDRNTGEVLETTLELADAAATLKGQMTVRYGRYRDFDVLVPLEMRETYSSSVGEQITAVATYSQFRRFETAGRLVIPQ